MGICYAYFMNDYESAFIQDVRNQVTQEAQTAASKKPKNKKVLVIVVVISVLIVALVSVFIWSVFFKQSSLICNSDKGDITIYYNHSKIADYKSSGMELNIEEQNKLFTKLGSEEYIKQFKSWHKKTSGVDCK